jgi:Tfp pilus assembly protein PilO
MNHKIFARRLWISFGVIAASIAVAVGAIYYLSGDLAVQAAAIVSARTKAQNQTAAVANLATLKAQAPQAAQYEAAFNKLLPSQYGLVTFNQWFANAGMQYGVTAGASFQGSATPSQGSTPGTTAFSFSVKGAPSNVEAFLDGVSKRATGFLLSIDSFDVSVDNGNYQVAGRGTLFSQ